MQGRRAQGLRFNCNERFTAEHKCQGSQLLPEGTEDTGEITCEKIYEDQQPRVSQSSQKSPYMHCQDRLHHE